MEVTGVDVTANSCAEEWRFLVAWCLVVQVK